MWRCDAPASERYTLAQLEALRDRTFRRRPAIRVRGEKSALAFINEVGFSFTLSDFGLPVPCLTGAVSGRRNPRWPRHTHHDYAIGLAWTLKDVLPAKKLVYYGKLVRGKPTLASLECFRAFFALVRDGKGSGDYLLDYRHGKMSRPACALLDALMEESPLYTPDLRRRAGLRGAERTAEFERAIGELQRGMWVVKTEERYDPDFCYRWDLLDNWLEAEVVKARALGRPEAAKTLVATYLDAGVFSTERLMASLLGLPKDEVRTAVDQLVAEGRAFRTDRVIGRPGEWVLSAVRLAGGRPGTTEWTGGGR